jgi:dTDP-3-amino-2,3,6-trideoxy-4-keto-D-glucose/dTDP-3-amino-3,4,6-trideoxy-alpha-D-glucose/dTDP-2,6-dideoxy-D-kanosamine transaminase
LLATQAIAINDLRRGACADEELADTVSRVVRSGCYLLGAETTAFESELAEYLDVDHAVGVANGTDALELALLAVGGGPGREVVTAANAGGYASLAARKCGMRVRFADVEDSDLLVSRRTVEQALTPATAVLVVTHLYGKMAPIAALCELCWSNGIAVVEDCAQAAGAHVDGRRAGSFGDAAAFSFYPTKNLAALGDGGAVVTSAADVAARVHRLRQYGWGAKYQVELDGGRNSRLDEMQAAVLRVRLRRLDALNSRRRAIAERYRESLSGAEVCMAQAGEDDYVAHLAVARAPRRDTFAALLNERGIATAVHYPVSDHRQPFIGLPALTLPVTEAAAAQVITLPCYPELENDEVDTVCGALAEVARWS